MVKPKMKATIREGKMSVRRLFKHASCIFLLLISVFASSVSAVEIRGKVIEVDGSKVKISYESDLAPREGDNVKIGSEIPGAGFIPVKGAWTVADVSEDFIWAKAEGSDAGEPGYGYIAIIFSDNPISKSQHKLGNELIKAIKSGDTAKVQDAIRAGADVNAKGESGDTPLGRAAGQGRAETVKALIKAGADIHWEAPRGQTALNVAAYEGHSEIVRILIDAGADVNATIKSKKAPKRFQGATPLLLAAERSHIETIRALIDAGADVNVRNSGGATSLILAASFGHIETILTLIDAGADVDSETTLDVSGPPVGSTALMASAHEGHLKAALALILANADLNAENRKGQTALTLAKKNGHAEIVEVFEKADRAKSAAKKALGKEMISAVKKGKMDYAKLLIKYGVDVNEKDKKGKTALIWAIENGSIKITQMLLDAGAGANTPDSVYGATPLMVAAQKDSNETLRLLLRFGADVNRKAKGDAKGEGAGWTALMAAAMAGSADGVSQLLRAGADPDIVNSAGKTALEIAIKEGAKEVIRLMEGVTTKTDRNGFKEMITWDFETGDLKGWETEGDAFIYQPTYGDNPTARRRGEPSNHQGDYWIGGYEKRTRPSAPPGGIQGDSPRGTLTSLPFNITSRFISFLIGGGCDIRLVRVELLIEGAVVHKATGKCSETMKRIKWDVSSYTGRSAKIRLVDGSSGGWGHINFDDVKFESTLSGMEKDAEKSRSYEKQNNYIPSLGAIVKNLLFYESGKDSVSYKNRKYKDKFLKSSSRYINWELLLEFPKPNRRINFEIVAIYYRPDGSVFERQKKRAYIDPGWASSFHDWGLGWKDPGKWKSGIYRVDLYIRNQKVASGSFRIYS
jgi:ankyrin repeat protein